MVPLHVDSDSFSELFNIFDCTEDDAMMVPCASKAARLSVICCAAAKYLRMLLLSLLQFGESG